MIHVYALLAAEPRLPNTAGLEERALESHAHRDIAAVFSRHDLPRIEPSVDNLLQHERTVEALMQQQDLLPARFGTRLKDESDLNRVLGRHHDSIVAGLERVRGCVELGVRVVSSEKTPAPQPEPAVISSGQRPGHAYMLARAAEERRRQMAEAHVNESASRVHEPLSRLARESILRPRLSDDLLLSAAYLVERDGVGSFRSRVEALSMQQPTLRILCTGPWPVYHFVPALNPLEHDDG